MYGKRWKDIMERYDLATAAYMDKKRKQYDVNAKALPDIPIGTTVWIQHHTSKL